MTLGEIGQQAIEVKAALDRKNQAQRQHRKLLKDYSAENDCWYTEDGTDSVPEIDQAYGARKTAVANHRKAKAKLHSMIHRFQKEQA